MQNGRNQCDCVFFYLYGTNRNIKIFIGSDDPDTRKEFSELCGQKKVKNFSVNTSAENPASSNTGASNQPLITIGMLERLNGNDKGDAIVSVRGYEPIWTRFTPSYELKDIYFAAGKADISKRPARLFDKSQYVFDILGGSIKKVEEEQLDMLERREQEEEQEELKAADEVAKLNAEWKKTADDIEKNVRMAAEFLNEQHGAALIKAPKENKLALVYTFMDEYDELSTQLKLKQLAAVLNEGLPKLLQLQEKANQFMKKEN